MSGFGVSLSTGFALARSAYRIPVVRKYVNRYAAKWGRRAAVGTGAASLGYLGRKAYKAVNKGDMGKYKGGVKRKNTPYGRPSGNRKRVKYSKSSSKRVGHAKAYGKRSTGRKGGKGDRGLVGGYASTCSLRFSSHRLMPKLFKTLTAPITVIIQGAKTFGVVTLNGALGDYTYMGQFDLDVLSKVANRQRAAGNAGVLAANYPANAPEAVNFKEFLVSSFTTQKLVNPTIYTIKVFIYDCVCKRDTGGSPATLATSDVTIVNSNFDISIPNDATLDAAVNGYKLWDSPQFKSHWAITRKTTIVLGPGAVHEHFIKANYNKLWSRADSSANGWLKGYSYSTVIQLEGFPIHDQGGVSSGVSNSPVSVEMTSVTRTVFRTVAQTNQHVELIQSVSSPTVVQFVEPMSGEVIRIGTGVLAGNAS